MEEVYAHCHGGNSDSDGDGEALAMGAVDDAVMRDLDVATNGFGGGPGALPQGEGAVTNAVGCSPNDASVGDEGGVRGRTQAQTSQTMCRRATLLLLLPDHRFVYLTGDSPNALTTLNDNTTYIIGGIADRNQLKFAAMKRGKSIDA